MGKAKRIRKEETRLKKIYKNLEGQKKQTVQGLIQRAAFMRVNQDPYERKRPVADLYNTMNTSYQKIIKQLTDLLPKDEPKPEDDGFDSFVGGREDD